MKGRVIGYWVATGLFALGFGAGGVFDVMAPPDVLKIMEHLGYPPYMARMIGVFKLLGVAAILVPGIPRIKEWAYAGIAIDLLGAAVSHASVGDKASDIITPLVFLAVAAASWALRPPSRVLGQILPGQDAQPALRPAT